MWKFYEYSSIDFHNSITPESIPNRHTESAQSDGNSLLVEVDAISAGRTKNHTIYTEKELRRGIPTWTMPYMKPILRHHLSGGKTLFGPLPAEDPLGRVTKARWNKAGETVRLIGRISSQDAIDKVLDERYLTVSIGTTLADVQCNVCGRKAISDPLGPCDHLWDKGKWIRYKPEGAKKEQRIQVGWIMLGITNNEFSFVNVPACDKAIVVDKNQDPDNWDEKLAEYANLEEVTASRESANGYLWQPDMLCLLNLANGKKEGLKAPEDILRALVTESGSIGGIQLSGYKLATTGQARFAHRMAHVMWGQYQEALDEIGKSPLNEKEIVTAHTIALEKLGQLGQIHDTPPEHKELDEKNVIHAGSDDLSKPGGHAMPKNIQEVMAGFSKEEVASTEVVKSIVDEAVKAATEELSQKLTSKESTIQDRDGEVETLNKSNEELDAKLKAASTAGQKSEASLKEKEAELATIQNNLESVEAERNALTKENRDLIARLHASLAGVIVQDKVRSGAAFEEKDKEKEIKELTGKGTDYLIERVKEIGSTSAPDKPINSIFPQDPDAEGDHPKDDEAVVHALLTGNYSKPR